MAVGVGVGNFFGSSRLLLPCCIFSSGLSPGCFWTLMCVRDGASRFIRFVDLFWCSMSNPMLYDSDPYGREFDASVESVKDGKYVVLSDTCFYPQGGGQPCDTGVLVKDGVEYPVVFVGKFDGKVSHEVSQPGLSVGDIVHGVLDWNRRHTLMRMHTAAHILSAVVHAETGAEITGNQLGVDTSRVDFSLESFDREKMVEYEAKANELIGRALPVRVEVLPRLEAEAIPSVFRLAKGFPAEITVIRVVRVGSVDAQACGGTHVRNLSEIGKLKLAGAENKGKSNRRIYYSLEPL